MAKFGDLFRAALPGTFADGAWQAASVPIIVDGAARRNAAAPCEGYHYKLGHEVRAAEGKVTYVTWTLENQEVKENATYEFAVDGAELVLKSGHVNLFCRGWVADPAGELAADILGERAASARAQSSPEGGEGWQPMYPMLVSDRKHSCARSH